ncbi:hypothetical protein NK362_24655, partial [Salmonella enterica]|uniref:hypothetical protein n=1 Tax=Salmonella enterica TaxID=28901 RepID=UPI0022B6E65D
GWLDCCGGLLVVYISISLIAATYGSALTAAHFLKDRNAGPAKSKQKVLAPTLGASLWLGMPAIRQ